jgi:putative Mg2+ transporter-C (MgtC) family protein
MLAFGISDWWFGDLHKALSLPVCSVVLVLTSVLCGTLIGLEREHRAKPAGVKTVSLICIGSTIFTITSILIAGDAAGDRGRIAAQVVTGIGFLGAGAIMRERGTIIGLTTGATIWVVSAIGVLIGAGYAAGGLAMTVVVLIVLIALRRSEIYLHRWSRGERPSDGEGNGERS